MSGTEAVAPKRLLIGGQWVPAASGKTFPSVNPSTGAVIAQLAEAGAADADRAVAAARARSRDRGVGSSRGSGRRCCGRWRTW